MQTLDVNSLFARAEQAFLAGRLDAARNDLLQVQRLAGAHPTVLHLLGLVETKRGDAAAAAKAFEAALNIAPRDPQILSSYANYLADRGEAEAALEAYRKALQSVPHFHNARYNRALLLQKLGRNEEASVEFDKVAAARPRDAKVHSARGSALRALGRLNEAAAAYDAALALEPNRATAVVGRARVAMERGEEGASARYARAAALRPGDLQVVLDFAEALEIEGDPAAAPTLAAAVAAKPDWAQGQKALARMRWEAGDGRAFTRDLERALEATPANRELWLAYASALAEADLHAEAADAAARGRVAVGDDPSLLLLEAVRASEAGQLDRADQLFELAPVNMVGRNTFEARHLIRTSHYERAAILVDRARRDAPWDISTWALTGVLWRLTSDPRAEWLLEQPGFVDTQTLPFRPEELQAIASHLRSLHRTRAHPIGQSLRGGTQTRGYLFAHDEPQIQQLRMAIEAAVAAYWDRLPAADLSHPLLRHRVARPRIAGSWSVRLTDGGYHTSHFHPEGAVSSACYFTVPEAQRPMEGWLEVGGPPGGLDVPIEPLHRIEPAPGRMTLFPSYLFHGTRPFSEGERLTVAFDVVT